MIRYLLLCMTIGALLVVKCACKEEADNRSNYKQDMRIFVQGISAYAKAVDTGFIIVPQNGQELLTADGLPGGGPALEYLRAIDGQGREDLFYGYAADDQPTPAENQTYLMSFLNEAERNGVEAMVTDYCSTHSNMDASYANNKDKNYVSFAASHRELDNIPDYPAIPYAVNADIIRTLSQVRNFLYVLNPTSFGSKDAYLAALRQTNYDLFIMDLFYDGVQLTRAEVDSLKIKPNGGRRLLIAYMSIGEAEDYRYYWQSGWKPGSPDFIKAENPEWKDNFKVRYWDPAWQQIIYGNNDSYVKKILDAGFNGTYLDIIDAFEYFEGL